MAHQSSRRNTKLENLQDIVCLPADSSPTLEAVMPKGIKDAVARYTRANSIITSEESKREVAEFFQRLFEGR